MKLFELTYMIVNLILAIMFIKQDKKHYITYQSLALSNFIIYLALMSLGGLRWQLLPIYLLTLLFVASSLYNLFALQKKDLKVLNRIIASSVIIVFYVSSLIAQLVFPVYQIPTPMGSYDIGTESFDMVDTSRPAIYSDDLSQPRKYKIQVWYPTDTTQGYKLAPWLENGYLVAQALSRDMKLPSFVLNHTAMIPSNSYGGAPLSNDVDKYPVILISHGWSGFRNLHTDWAESLASQGYVVISIDHTYGSQVTIFEDGQIAYLNYDALPSRQTTPMFLEFANTLVNTYGQDVKHTIDSLESIYTNSPMADFKNRLDLSHIGLIGHSTGGGGDVALAIEDKRIKALIGMDAWVEPIDATQISQGLDIPALFIRSSQWEVGYNNDNLLKLLGSSSIKGDLYQIQDTTHYDFSMVYMYSPLTKYIGLTGKNDPKELSEIMNTMMSNFFQTHLKESSIEIDYSGQWPQVIQIQ